MTPHSGQCPKLRCLPEPEWPAQDSGRWAAQLRRGDDFEADGSRAWHSPYSNRCVEAGYGKFLAWLAGQGTLDPHVSPGDRITRDVLRAYVAELFRHNSTGTILVNL